MCQRLYNFVWYYYHPNRNIFKLSFYLYFLLQRFRFCWMIFFIVSFLIHYDTFLFKKIYVYWIIRRFCAQKIAVTNCRVSLSEQLKWKWFQLRLDPTLYRLVSIHRTNKKIFSWSRKSICPDISRTVDAFNIVLLSTN